MNALVTLNLNSFMPSKVRDSFQAAAQRWDVAYVEITTPLAPIHHFWQKAIIPLSQGVAGFDRVLQLDCDMLVGSDCPSPFDLVPATNVGVVSRCQHRNRVPRMQFESRKPGWAREMGLTPYAHPWQHLNAGFIMYGPQQHAALLAAWQAAGRRCKWSDSCTVPEQFALSCLLQSMNVPVTWLPASFNTLRARLRPAGPMQTYIYHYNGPRGRNLEAAVGRHQWKLR